MKTITIICLAGFAACALAATARLLWARLAVAWRRANPVARAAFAVAVGLATLYGGTKGTITYPRTDPDTWYLVDNGSYVTNNHVHVSFLRNILVPSTATFYLDGMSVRYTNQSDWATHSFTAYTSTFAAMQLPVDVAYVAATGYNWIAYTDWVPPPVVHTNGVAFVAWQIGVGKATNDLAMTRTGVYANADKLAPNPGITNGPPTSALSVNTNTDNPNE